MAKTALISGGRGFLGHHLARTLCERGWNVHVTTRSANGDRMHGIISHRCDLADRDSAAAVLDSIGPDAIFHLAGAVGASTDMELVLPAFHSHATSALNLMTLVTGRAGCRLVLIGSLLEALDGEIATSPYSAAKTVVTLYSRMFHFLYQAPVVVARTFMTYGPGQRPEKVLPYTIRSFAAGETPRLSSGDWRADWVFVTDVVEGLILAGTRPGIEGTVFDLGRGELLSLKEMVMRIRDLMGGGSEPAFGARSDRLAEPERAADLVATRALLDWTPTVSLDDGLRTTIAAYTAQRIATNRADRHGQN